MPWKLSETSNLTLRLGSVKMAILSGGHGLALPVAKCARNRGADFQKDKLLVVL